MRTARIGPKTFGFTEMIKNGLVSEEYKINPYLRRFKAKEHAEALLVEGWIHYKLHVRVISITRAGRDHLKELRYG